MIKPNDKFADEFKRFDENFLSRMDTDTLSGLTIQRVVQPEPGEYVFVFTNGKCLSFYSDEMICVCTRPPIEEILSTGIVPSELVLRYTEYTRAYNQWKKEYDESLKEGKLKETINILKSQIKEKEERIDQLTKQLHG